MISYGKQSVNTEDMKAVLSCMESDYLTQGTIHQEFEQEISLLCEGSYATSCNSGTSALHIACMVLGLSQGDWLWTSANSFVASANCGRYCGAQVDFVDIDISTGLMSVDSLSEKLRRAKEENKLPKILVAVHYAGQSCDMEAISILAREYNFRVIEDACHAFGGYYQGRRVGSCDYSDACVFSFHPLKSITTAEGGAVLFPNKADKSKADSLMSHGIVKRPDVQPWYYEQSLLGFNYRLSDMQAALGLSQLSRLDEFIARRQEIDALYRDKLSGVNLDLLKCERDCISACHLFPVLLPNSKMRMELYVNLREVGIQSQVHYIPIYKQPYYKEIGYQDLKHTEAFYSRILSIPIYPDLTDGQTKFVIEKVIQFVGEYDVAV